MANLNMGNKIRTVAAILTAGLSGQIANAQESVYDAFLEGGNTKIVTGTTAHNGPTYLGSQDLNELTSASTGSVSIKRGGITYTVTSQTLQPSPGGHTQVLGGTTFTELNTNFSTSYVINGFDESGASTTPLAGGLYNYIENSYSGDAPSALANDNKAKTIWYEVLLTPDFVNNLLEGDEVRIRNRSGTMAVTGGFANGNDLLVLTKTGGQLVVTQDTGYTAVTLDTEEFNALTPSYALFPNPATVGGEINISGITDTYAVEGYTYVIYDMMGRVVGEVKKGNGPITVPTEPGIYIVEVLIVGGKKVSKRIIVE